MHVRARVVAGCVLFSIAGCGSEETAAGAVLLDVSLEEQMDDTQRRRLVGVVSHEEVVTFPDAEGAVRVEVVGARLADAADDGSMLVDMNAPLSHIRSVNVTVERGDGYELSATLIGQPTNAGTTEAPIERRLLQITRNQSNFMGTTGGQMTIDLQPSAIARQ